MAWIPIRYRDFYDIPRAFIVEREGSLFLFDGAFDESIDEYPDRFQVYRLRADVADVLDATSWHGLEANGTLIGEVPVADVRFDPTRRAAVDDTVLAMI